MSEEVSRKGAKKRKSKGAKKTVIIQCEFERRSLSPINVASPLRLSIFFS
jgi:hypothetical protein